MEVIMKIPRKANPDITTVNSRSIGIDVHKDKFVACFAEVRKECETSHGLEEQINYQFLTVRGNPDERQELIQWIQEKQPEVIIMESTGIYWKALFCEMEEAGLHPELINPRHFHSAEEGRKTDKTDAKWLANLARLGLYRASFIPEEPMRTLRLDVVALHKLTTERIADKNRLTKILDDSGIHFSRVFTDPTEGKTARAVLQLLLEGNLTAEAIENVRNRRCRATTEEILATCRGELSEGSRILVQMYLDRLEMADQQIERITKFMETELERAGLLQCVQLLETIPGCNHALARDIVCIVGGGESLMRNFASEHQFSRWAGTCPGNNESAGVRKSSKCPHGLISIKTLLVEAAQAAARSNETELQDLFKKKRFKGYNQAVMVVAHKLTKLIFILLTRNVPYRDHRFDYDAGLKKKSKPRWLKWTHHLLEKGLISKEDLQIVTAPAI